MRFACTYENELRLSLPGRVYRAADALGAYGHSISRKSTNADTAGAGTGP
jgi:hypothetical protein